MWAGFVEWLVMHLLVPLFPSRYRLIPRKEDGEPLLRQFRLWGSPSFGSGAYLQSFVNAELENDFHNHRWTKMRSIVLCGEFLEERFPGNRYIVHRGGTTYTMDWTVIHRLAGVRPRTWTLFICKGGPTEWGYYKRPAKDAIPYEPASRAINPSKRVPPV